MVCLWLGVTNRLPQLNYQKRLKMSYLPLPQANVMLEYTYDEAFELLTGNLKSAKETVESLDADLDFIKDQITTTEVSLQPYLAAFSLADKFTSLLPSHTPPLGILGQHCSCVQQ